MLKALELLKRYQSELLDAHFHQFCDNPQHCDNPENDCNLAEAIKELEELQSRKPLICNLRAEDMKFKGYWNQQTYEKPFDDKDTEQKK